MRHVTITERRYATKPTRWLVHEDGRLLGAWLALATAQHQAAALAELDADLRAYLRQHRR